MKNIVKILIIILVVLAIVLTQNRWDIAEKFSTENISGWLDNAGIYAPLFYIAMMALAIIFSPIPSLPLDIAAGRYFGPIPGTIYSVVGATIGATISFLLARDFWDAALLHGIQSTRIQLSVVALKIKQALRLCGYYEMSYYAVPDGFAIVTRLEQMNEDGTSKDMPERWEEKEEMIFFRHFWESLCPYSVGYKRGVMVIERNLVDGTRAEPVNTKEKAFQKLNAGRTDIVIGTRLVGLKTLKKLGFEGIHVVEPPLQTSYVFHYLHVSHRDLVEPLTEILRKMEQDRSIERFREQVMNEM